MAIISIKLQSPTIELPVKAKDASGTRDNLLVGFKRYPIEEAQDKLDNIQILLEGADRVKSLQSAELDTFITNEVVYIKQAKLDLDENGKVREFTIADTRQVKPIADLWENGDECLSVLLKMYLSSAPYRLALILASQKALMNNDYSADELKNL